MFLLSIVMNNLTETSFLKGTHSLWFLFLLTAVNLPSTVHRKKTEKIGQLQDAPPELAEVHS